MSCEPDEEYVISAAGSGDVARLRRLLKEGADYKVSNYKCVTPLHAAASEGHLGCVEVLLEAAQAEYSSTEQILEHVCVPANALSVAAGNGHSAVVGVLVGLYSGCCAEKTGFALSEACRNNNVECIKILLKNIPENLMEIDGRCDLPVHITAKYGNLDAMKVLHCAGADLSAKSIALHTTPLHVACRSGNIEIIEYLLENTRDINASETTGFTPLYHAAASNEVETLHLLLKNGGNPCKDHGEYGASCPLAESAGRGHIDVVKMLARHVRKECGSQGIMNALYNEYNDCLEYLLQNGFSTFVSTSYDDVTNPWNLLLYDSHFGHKNVSKTFEILIENGTLFRELANFDRESHLAIFPGQLILVNFYNLQVFLDFGLAELQWACSPLSSFSDFVKETQDAFRGAIVSDPEDERLVIYLRESRELLPKLKLYLKYFPFARFSFADVTLDGMHVYESLSERVISVVGTLKKLCRWTVRSCITSTNGSVTTKLITRLGLPNCLEDFILFKNEPSTLNPEEGEYFSCCN